jgi:hypothetical protein
MLGSVTIDFSSLMIGLVLAVLTMVGCVIMLLGWFFYLQTKLRRSPTLDGQLHGPPLISPGAWGEPDLAPPSTSAAARAEVVELDAVWTPAAAPGEHWDRLNCAAPNLGPALRQQRRCAPSRAHPSGGVDPLRQAGDDRCGVDQPSALRRAPIRSPSSAS